jgi:hypothetical protein
MVTNLNLRRGLIIATAPLPFILYLIWGGSNDCYLGGAGGEACFGFGFGLVLTSPAMLLWAISAIAGYVISNGNTQT